AGQVQNSVQGEDTDFIADPVAELARIACGKFGGDGDVTGKAEEKRWSGKRQHVGCAICSLEAHVQRPNLAIAGDHYRNCSTQTSSPAGSDDEFGQRAPAQTRQALLVNDGRLHLRSKTKRGRDFSPSHRLHSIRRDRSKLQLGPSSN